jgi:hypothetical protein
MADEFEGVRTLIKFAYADLDRRVTTLESRT